MILLLHVKRKCTALKSVLRISKRQWSECRLGTKTSLPKEELRNSQRAKKKLSKDLNSQLRLRLASHLEKKTETTK